MRLSVSVLVLTLLLCVQWQVHAELSRSEIYKAVKLAKAAVDSAYEFSRRESLSRVRRDVVSPRDTLIQMKMPAGMTREAVRRADYMQWALSYFKKDTAQTQAFRMSEEDMDALAAASGCAQLTSAPSCSSVSNLYIYPSNTPFLRLLHSEYQDRVSLPKGWDSDRRVNNRLLPLVRDVSNHILKTGNTVDLDPLFSMLVTFFGQWTDHDITLTPMSPVIRAFNSSETCVETCERSEPCFPIQVPKGDTRLSRNDCIPFIRSAPVCTTSGKREQLNAITAFIDVGQGPLLDKGLMKVNQDHTDNGKELLPFSNMTVNMCATRRRITMDNSAEEVSCFQAGDERVNENIALASLHTLFLREHNRLARALAQLNPHWGGEKLYQEARKILGAQSQVITYRDYLLHILGPDVIASRLSTYPGYDDRVDPSISNVFATAAYRFAHLMIQPVMRRFNEEYREHQVYPSPELHKTFFAPGGLSLKIFFVDMNDFWTFAGGLDPILRGMIGTQAKLNTQNHMMPDELREKLFKFNEKLALDLGSLNMQRGRDHGLPGYNAWRGFCNLSQPKNVKELAQVLNNKDLAKKLMDLYGTPDNIDVWLGGLSEPLVDGGRVGPLFACLIADQFQRIRSGDRLWWENDGVFTESQRKSLRESSIARIICENTGITEVPEQPFQYRPRGDGYKSCEDIPELDLSPWQENSLRGPAGPPGPRGPPGPSSPTSKVAFAAQLGNDFPREHRTIVFHKIIYNYPGHYNKNTGRFTCNVPGVYEFHMSLVIDNSAVGVDMMKEGDERAENILHSYNTHHGGAIMASGSIITRLKKGDEVYLVINEGSNRILKDSNFSGHLLFTED
ncbi:hypothetical protein WMY93_000234 [Mugilogobius chulae]|uniref:C1q domain-containing protein n=1 Tax=Mugilogobius chulae TaxID=88201 RepID=A0AAW0PYB4_9GOBI